MIERQRTNRTSKGKTYTLALVYSDGSAHFYDVFATNLISAIINTLHNTDENHTNEEIVEIQVMTTDFVNKQASTIIERKVT